MVRFRRILRLVVQVFGSCFVVAAVFVVASYSYGQWYAAQSDTAQHEVWSAYLNHALLAESPAEVGRTVHRPVIVIRDHTQEAYRHTILALLWPVVARSDDRMYQRLPALQFGVYARYLLGNLRSHSIRQNLSLSESYRLATSGEVAAYGETGDRWRRLFPQSAGYFVFSSVGFNGDQTQAMLHVDYVCGLCGGGSYVLLRKLNGAWTVEAEARTSVS